MKPVSKEVVSVLAERFGYREVALEFLGGGNESSDGIVYKVMCEGEKFVFKILHKPAGDGDEISKTRIRTEFFAYLGSRGVRVVKPRMNKWGNLIEVYWDGDDCFLAYTYPFVEGEHPSPKKWNSEIIRSWGSTIGKAHRLAGEYEYWDGVVSEGSGERVLCWEEELGQFHKWCKDPQIKEYWRVLGERIEELPKHRKSHGFIHNDPHRMNVVVQNNQVALLDFDVASCHFFACDIAIAIQSILFTAGGLDRPVEDQAAIRRFAADFYEGYRRETELLPEVEEAVELFVAYRRALLYTVSQEGRAQNPEAFADFKHFILEEVPIFG